MPTSIVYAIILGLIASFGWGSGDLLASLVARKLNEVSGPVFTGFFIVMFSVLLVLFTPVSFSFTTSGILLASLGGLLHGTAFIAFLKGARIGKISVVAAVSSAWSLIVFTYALLFRHEALSNLHLVAVLLTILGTILVSTNITALFKKSQFKLTDPSVPLGIIALLGWGFGFIPLGMAIDSQGWFSSFNILSVTSALITFVYGKFSIGIRVPTLSDTKLWMTIIGVALLSFIGYVSYSIGVEYFPTAIVGPLGATYPLVTIIFAVILLKEKISSWQRVGISMSIAGIVLLSL